MKNRQVSIQFIFNGLKNIRTANHDGHATTMHFIGYIGACLHLGGITAEQYLALFELAQNAFKYRSKELNGAL
jgi:hypothetical protein